MRTSRGVRACVQLVTTGSAIALLGASSVAPAQSAASRNVPIIVASKPFGESYLLAEMFAQLLEAQGLVVDRRLGLGQTEIAMQALRSGAIDCYPEYTGTGLLAVLHDSLTDSLASDPRLVFTHVARAFGSRYGVRWLPPLGFQNSYAIAVRRNTAAQYHLRTMSDLARESAHLVAGFTADFIGRPDGLAGLARVYGVRPRAVRPLAPAVKYQALATGAVDVIDGYSTDGLLSKYDLVTLVDDKHFFPPYEAAALVGARLARGRPDAVAVLTTLRGMLDESRMRVLNRRIEVDGEDVKRVAAHALREIGLTRGTEPALGAGATLRDTRSLSTKGSLSSYLWERRAAIWRLVLQHLLLVALALGAAIIVALPLALALERARRIAEPMIGSLGVLETIPSIALLAFMIPLFGIGVKPALVALWIYALYPIVRSAYSGVRDANPLAVEAAEALGMTPWQRLLQVRLPLAAPVIMAGIRTAAVITVGAATLAAFIGAGGLGEPIVAGLALADTNMILSGALPAAALALAVDGALALVERAVAPAHLRHTASR